MTMSGVLTVAAGVLLAQWGPKVLVYGFFFTLGLFGGGNDKG